jgi:hypothetical protein
MRKVKNFKIPIHDREIARTLKKLANIPELSEDILHNISEACRSCLKIIQPSILYETFPKDSLTLESGEAEIPNKVVAKTVVFATIGNTIEEEYLKNKELYGQYTQDLYSAIAVEALQQCKKFALKLIISEANEEDCRIALSIEVNSNNYAQLQNLIPTDKINISCQNMQLIPKYSLCELAYWTAAKKKSR